MGSFTAVKCAMCEVSTKLLDSEAAAIEVWNRRKESKTPISTDAKSDAELKEGLEQMRRMVTGEIENIGNLVRANPQIFRAQPLDSTLSLARRRLEQLVTDQRRINGEPYGNLYEPIKKPANQHNPNATHPDAFGGSDF